MNRIALKTINREKKAPVVETIKSSFDKQIESVAILSDATWSHHSRQVAGGISIYINPEYDESSPLFNPDKTLKEWCDIKGITLAEFPNYNPDNDRITTTPTRSASLLGSSNVSGITRMRLPKLVTGVDVCIITLGEYIKFFKNKIDYVSQTRLYYKKHEGFLPEGCIKREKDMSGDTSYYSMLSCEPQNIEKLKQYIKMNIRVDKVKWL